MSPAKAKQKIRIYGTVGWCLASYSLLTIAMSMFKFMYVNLLQGTIYNSSGFIPVNFWKFIGWFKSLEIPDFLNYWWLKSPTPLFDLIDYHNMLVSDNFWFVFHFLILKLAMKFRDRKKELRDMLNDANRLRQLREWESHPDL